jgi:hypothetical protein
MKRGIIRGLWGIYDKSHRITQRRYRMDKDMNRILRNKYNEPFVVYVLGQENYDKASKEGFDCILLDKDPFLFDLVKHQYRHKLEILKYAMEEDGYDEILYLDWDVIPQKKMPANYWDIFGQKEVFQACLQMYHRRKAHWRRKELRKVPNGGFVYIRDKSIPQRAIDLWEKLGKQDNDEPSWAKMTDDMVGGWKGIEKYWELFEVPFCNLHKGSPFPPEKLKKKDVCFIHYQG